MNNKVNQPFWDVGYSQFDISCMGGPSVEIFEIAPALKPNSKVVEVGCGEGRNVFYLAQLGHQVYATDISQKAIEKLNYLASEFNVNVSAKQEDLAEMIFPDNIDVMIGHTVFHFLEKQAWQEKLSEAKKKTNPGGIHFFTMVLQDEKYPIPDEIMACGHLCSFEFGDLKEFYSDWEIIRFDHYVKWDSHPGIDMHSHVIEKFVARKPGGEKVEFLKETLCDEAKQDKLDDIQFNHVNLGATREQVLANIGSPLVCNKMSVPVRSLSGNNQQVTINKYTVEDLIYGKYGLQFVNEVLTGKYLYFTPPLKVTIR